MLVMWVLVLVRNRASAASQFEGQVGLMVGGILSFVAISTVLVLFTVFLVHEIREVRRQDSFIDSVTHELKSPLAAVRLALETMSRRDLDPDRRDQVRSMAIDDVARLNALIDGILAASRVGVEDKRSHRRERIRLRETFEDAVDTCARRHHLEGEDEGGREGDGDGRGADEHFTIEVDEDLEIMGDPAAWQMVLENLVDNAIKYSGSAPRVTLRGRREPGRVVVEVADQGIGIKKADLRRVFQRFYRVPEEEVRARHGTGLGLYIVSAMVRGMGGRVEAHSDGPGHGAAFVVKLPDRA